MIHHSCAILLVCHTYDLSMYAMYQLKTELVDCTPPSPPPTHLRLQLSMLLLSLVAVLSLPLLLILSLVSLSLLQFLAIHYHKDFHQKSRLGAFNATITIIIIAIIIIVTAAVVNIIAVLSSSSSSSLSPSSFFEGRWLEGLSHAAVGP